MTRVLLLLLLAATAAHADAPYSTSSIYNLEVTLTNQAGIQHGLDIYDGHPVLIAMFYGSCPQACPLLIDTLRTIERSAQSTGHSRLRVLMISIDPERDTIGQLRALAQARHIDSSRWTLARADAAAVQKIAAMLNVQYRRLPDGDYNHTSVITLLSRQGEIVLQSSVIGKADERLLQSLHDL